MLIDAEWDERHNRRIERSIKNARFNYKSNIENINFDTSKIKKSDFKTFDESIFSISNVVEENRNNKLTISQIVETEIKRSKIKAS